MTFSKLERWDKEREAARAAEREEAAKRALRREVRAVLPKGLRAPKRGKGRTPAGGLSRKEVAQLRVDAERYLDGEGGMEALESAVQHTALVILLIDGVLGTEPWRTAGPHGGFVAAGARLRYMETAARLLEDLRRRLGRPALPAPTPESKLLEGVIDAEPTGAE